MNFSMLLPEEVKTLRLPKIQLAVVSHCDEVAQRS